LPNGEQGEVGTLASAFVANAFLAFRRLAPNGMNAIHGHVQSPHFAQELSHSVVNGFSLLEYWG
jgi:hypothetical protein